MDVTYLPSQQEKKPRQPVCARETVGCMWPVSRLFAVGKTCFTWSKRAEIYCLTVYYKQLVNGGTRCDLPPVSRTATHKKVHIFTQTHVPPRGPSWICTAACDNDDGEQTNRSPLRGSKLKNVSISARWERLKSVLSQSGRIQANKQLGAAAFPKQMFKQMYL